VQNQAEKTKKHKHKKKNLQKKRKEKRGSQEIEGNTNLAKNAPTFNNSQTKAKLLEESLHKILSDVFR
jgi:hypothetical protein